VEILFRKPLILWRSLRDSNSCYSLESAELRYLALSVTFRNPINAEKKPSVPL
jgi:hypothetical protein